MNKTNLLEDFLFFGHSFNSGDLISVMPGIKKLCQDRGKKAIIYQRLNIPADYSHSNPHPVRDARGIQVCMNENMFNMLKPLIEFQEYVERFEVWEGQDVDFNFDLTRQNTLMPIPGGDIHFWPVLIYPQMHTDYSRSWIDAPGMLGYSDKIIVNRTERYRNPYITYHFLKDYENHVLFSGTRDEHKVFCEENDLNIGYLKIHNFLDLAGVIRSCKLFIGNQSMQFHIADAMKSIRMVEVCSSYPNTFPSGANGYAFITQGALETIFKKLIQ